MLFYHAEVRVAGVQLAVDLFVQPLLALRVQIVTYHLDDAAVVCAVAIFILFSGFAITFLWKKVESICSR